MSRSSSKSEESWSFAFSPGLFGGSVHSRKFANLLRRSGYRPAASLIEADIIVAHSAGCWLIPPSAKPKLVIYVGMPLAQSSPRHAWLSANAKRIRADRLHVVSGLLKSAYYGALQPRRNIHIIRMAKSATPIIFPNVPAIFIMNRYDPWPRAAALQKLIDAENWTFISLPGSHDDIWEHPARYAQIISNLY